MKIKLNVKYEWYSENEIVLHILNNFKRNNRKIKKFLKISIKDISKTLNVYDWNIIINIRKTYTGTSMKYYCNIKLQSKINNINGDLMFADIKEILSNTGYLKYFQYIPKDNSFFNKLVDDKHTVFLILSNYQENNGKVIDFQPIENEEITDFKNKHEGFLKYIHNNNIYTFIAYKKDCRLQSFYVSDKIYWRCSYCFPYVQDAQSMMGHTNFREIKEHDTKTFLRSMIEASVININQDIEEVLTWDIKDIFAMSKLIGY